jgi:hypothetical protein
MVYSLKLKNKKLLDFLFFIAKRKGIHICENYQKEKHSSWEYFQYRVDEKQIIGSRQKIGEEVSIDEMIDLLEAYKQNFKLNCDYTAIIDKRTKKVIVGCQEFDFDVIKKLAEILK